MAIERIVVRPGPPLEGTVAVAGAKNSALKLMAATLLAEGSYRVSNVPRIVDVDLMAELLRAVGCAVEWDPTDAATLRIHGPSEISPVPPYAIVERFRASVVVLGPMLARCGEAKVALPGGDDFGPRPVDMHVRGLVELGAQVDVVHGYIEASATELLGGRVLLEFPSVGATENLLMAAVAAKGTTEIDN
ncbi:MAG: UDP-N-acetylglucosamine 1-carboxyvinyltransferase, partial [Acidimicrobiaceae bacterium]|nr:UDP-N-acetylglucosamine 1-carboxyvinyltransferase [Acidimicrobiaceae bacterium]